MPTGIYIRTEEHRRKISNTLKGHHPVNEFKKGCKPFKTSFRNGYLPSWTDKKRASYIGTKIGNSLRGKSKSSEHKLKLSLVHLGKPSPRKGKFLSEETKKKLSISHKGQKPWWVLKNLPHPAYRGGISSTGYSRDFYNPKLKEFIRQRDGNKCQLCGCPQIESLHKLRIHHINYNKKDTRLLNLITLCNSCNWYERYFKSILKLRRRR